MMGNRSELAPGRKSPRCHVNTPLVTEQANFENEALGFEFEFDSHEHEFWALVNKWDVDNITIILVPSIYECR